MKKYKKIIIIILIIIILSIFPLYYAIDNDLIFSKVDLITENIDLFVGDSYAIEYQINSNNISDLSWYSEDNSIVSINENGIITGVRSGRTRIYLAYDTKRKYCEVIVKDIPIAKLELHHKSLDFDMGDIYKLHYDYSPNNATLSTISWHSDNENVVTVSNGIIKAVGKGEAKVTIEAESGAIDECTIRVLDSPLFSFSNNNDTIYQEETIDVNINDLSREYQNLIVNVYLNGELKNTFKDKIDHYNVNINQFGKWEIEAYLDYDEQLESKKVKKTYKVATFSSVSNSLEKDINNISFDSNSNTLLFGSDYQGSYRDKSLKKILDNISANNITPGLITFLGDYASGGYSEKVSSSGVKALNSIFRSYNNLVNSGIFYVQGNHDPEKTNYLAHPGEYEATNYGLFIINEDDFASGKNAKDPTRIKNLVARLDSYLNNILLFEIHKPIFVVTHVPLHFSSRGDNPFASIIVDVLNKYGDKLDIIFMYGHNHSSDFDACLGGSINYVEKGKTLKYYRFDENKKKATSEENIIKFTYLNAGYVGYNANKSKIVTCSGTKVQSYNAASMTVFTIDDSVITVNRYGDNNQVYTSTIKRVN